LRVGVLKKADADKARERAARTNKSRKHIRKTPSQRYYTALPRTCRCDPNLPDGEGGCIKCGKELTPSGFP